MKGIDDVLVETAAKPSTGLGGASTGLTPHVLGEITSTVIGKDTAHITAQERVLLFFQPVLLGAPSS